MLALKHVNKDANYHNILKDALELRFHRERHVCIKEKCQFLANHHTNQWGYSFQWAHTMLSTSYMLAGTGMNARRDVHLQKQPGDTSETQAAQFRFILSSWCVTCNPHTSVIIKYYNYNILLYNKGLPVYNQHVFLKSIYSILTSAL